MPLVMKVTSASDTAEDDNYWLSTYSTLAGIYPGWMLIDSFSFGIKRPEDMDEDGTQAEALRSRHRVTREDFTKFLQALVKSPKSTPKLPPGLAAIGSTDLASLQKKGATSWMKHSKARGGKSSNALEIDELEIVKPFDPATAALFHWSVRAVKPDAPLSVEFVVEVHQIVGAAYQDGDKWEHKPVVQLTFEGCIPKNYTAACSGGDQLPKETIRLKVRKGKVVYQEFDETGYPIKDATDNHEFTQEEVPEGTA